MRGDKKFLPDQVCLEYPKFSKLSRFNLYMLMYVVNLQKGI